MDKKVQIIFDALNRTDKTFGEIQGNMGKLSSTVSKVTSLLGGLGLTIGFGAMVNDLIDVNAEFQKLNAQLVTVTGSQEAANAAFGWLEEFATTTPYQLNEVVSGFVKLQSMGLDPSRESLEAYGNTASAMGKSLDQMIEAVADAATGEFERLKEFGIRASQQGDRVTFTFRGISTTVNKTSADITRYLKNIGNTDFSGAMALQMDTIDGKLSNLRDSWDKFLRQLGDAGAIDAAIGAIEALGESIQFVSKGFKDIAYYYKQMADTRHALGLDGLREKLTLEKAKELGLDKKTIEAIEAYEKGTGPFAGRKQEATKAPVKIPQITVTAPSGPTESEKDRLTRVKQEIANLQRENKDLEESIVGSDEAFTAFLQTLDLTDSQVATLKDGLTLYDDSLDSVSAATEQLAEKTDSMFDEMANAVQGWASDFSAQLNDIVWDADASFGQILESFARMLTQMAIQKTAVEPLLGVGLSFLSGLGGTSSAAAATSSGFSSSIDYSAFSLRAPAHHSGGMFTPKIRFPGLGPDEGLAVLLNKERTFDPDQTKIVDGLAALGHQVANQQTGLQVNIINPPSTPTVTQNSDGSIDVLFDQVEGRIASRIAEGKGPISKQLGRTMNTGSARGRY